MLLHVYYGQLEREAGNLLGEGSYAPLRRARVLGEALARSHALVASALNR